MKKLRKNLSRTRSLTVFVTPQQIKDLLVVHWNSMGVLKDNEDVVLDTELPSSIKVNIKLDKRKEGAAVFRVLSG